MRPDDFHERVIELEKENEELKIALKTVVKVNGGEIKRLESELEKLSQKDVETKNNKDAAFYRCIECNTTTPHVTWNKHKVFNCFDIVECTECGTRMQRGKLTSTLPLKSDGQVIQHLSSDAPEYDEAARAYELDGEFK